MDRQLAPHLQRLDELSDYTVETGDLDPRGWTVTSSYGRTLGTVEDLIVDTTTMKVRYFEVDLDDSATDPNANDGYVLVDATTARLDENRRHVIAEAVSYSSAYAATQQPTADSTYSGQAGTGRTFAAPDATPDRARLTRSEEELRIGKREVARGEARVTKRVETEHVREPVTRRREEAVIERRPVTPGSEATASIEEGEIRVPLMEEEVVVDKRPVVKEEVVIGKRVVEETEVVETDLRKERFEVDNEPSKAADRDPKRGSPGKTR
jgi:uncharacterized protein (TIGR02271 family)